MSSINTVPKYINIGCGANSIKGWANYDYNKFIFFARIKILRYFLNHLRIIPEGYKVFMDKVVEENIRFANAGKHIPEKDNSVNVLSQRLLEVLRENKFHKIITYNFCYSF